MQLHQMQSHHSHIQVKLFDMSGKLDNESDVIGQSNNGAAIVSGLNA